MGSVGKKNIPRCVPDTHTYTHTHPQVGPPFHVLDRKKNLLEFYKRIEVFINPAKRSKLVRKKLN